MNPTHCQKRGLLSWVHLVAHLVGNAAQNLLLSQQLWGGAFAILLRRARIVHMCYSKLVISKYLHMLVCYLLRLEL
jgi:hypothetical protein